MTREEKPEKEFLTPWGERLDSLRLLGKGAFSRVYLAREEKTGTLFACKVSGERGILEREGALMERLRHPLFPDFCGQWQRDGKGYLLMEYVCGGSLEELLVRRGSFSERQIRRVGIALAEGLLTLHQQPEPMAFRDVKPQNIIIRQDGGVKLLDLGAACSMREPGSLAGTPGYAAPEQLKRGEPLTPACDVYGLGKTLLAMAGPGCRKKLKDLLQRCTRKEPKERPWDMRLLRDALADKKGLPAGICLENIWESNYKQNYDAYVEI